MTRSTFFALFLSLLLSSGVTAETVDAGRVAGTLDTLRESVNDHDYARLEPALAADFSYQGREAGFSRMIMQQVVAGYPHELSEIAILGITGTDDAWEVAVRLVSPSGTEQRTVRLDRDYRLLQADIADIQLAGHDAPTAAPQDVSADIATAVIVPFTLATNLIIVDAEINGVAGNYLVDTGAQATVLNANWFTSGELVTVPLDHAPPSGVGGVMQDVRGATGLALEWGAIRVDDLRGLVTDLSHLEASIGVPLVGIIGFDVLERFEIHFDYAASELTLYRLDDKGHPIVRSDIGEPLQITPFEMASHLPVLPVKIAGFEMRMGLDSGAAGAMLFERWQAPLAGEYAFIERRELRGGDRNVQMGDVVRIDSMRVQNIDYADMTFRFNDIAAHGGKELPMDGLLGYEFLKSRPTAINFRRQELMIW